jgi:hypothetical protein
MQIKYKLNYDKQDKYTKLVWKAGDVKNVTPQLGDMLLRHADVWELAEGESATEAIGLPEVPKETEEPLPVVDFHGMNKDAMIKFIADECGEKIDKRLAEPTVRFKAMAFYAKKQADLG